MAAGAVQTEFTGPLDCRDYSRANLAFRSQGEELDAWLYMPSASQQAARGGGAQPQQQQQGLPPIAVMAHGMGAQKDMGLHAYASAFAAGGLAVLVFDYRGFGGSQGAPRQWVSPARHLQDWQAAVEYVTGPLSDRVDTSRMCLWGTSFAGGHVLVTAAANARNVVAVVSQVPHLDAGAATRLSIAKRGIPKTLAAFGLGLLDRLSGAFGGPPLYLPLVGPAGSLAFMQLNEFETKEYFSKHPPVYQGAWENKARAALVAELAIGRYSPINAVPDVACPILFVAATQDELCPVDQVRRAVKLARDGALLSRDCTHFELYRGALFEGLIGEQVAFFRRATGLDGGEKKPAPAPAGAAAR